MCPSLSPRLPVSRFLHPSGLVITLVDAVLVLGASLRPVLLGALALLAAHGTAGGALTEAGETANPSPPEQSRGKVLEPVARDGVVTNMGAERARRWFRTLSGTSYREATSTYQWWMYPGYCPGGGPSPSFVVDDLNSYAEGTTASYSRADHSLKEQLWHVVDATTPAGERPAIAAGARSLWCGKYDAIWSQPVGYPNDTYQILYLDTGQHGADYTLALTHAISAQFGRDHLYLIGGGNGAIDPIGNSRAMIEEVLATGTSGFSRLLVSWTGSITSGGDWNTVPGPIQIQGASGAHPVYAASTFVVAAEHRALYLVFKSSDWDSSEDGAWPFGKGIVIDNLSTSDLGILYDEHLAVGGSDAFGGTVIRGTPAQPVIAARVPPGVGELWQIVSGAFAATNDFCSPDRNAVGNHLFFGADPTTRKTVPHQMNSVASCLIPITPGTTGVAAGWTDYMDLPRGSGYTQFADFRVEKNGVWTSWLPISRYVGGLGSWGRRLFDLQDAVQAQWIQIRYGLRCDPQYAADGVSCSPSLNYGVLYDDFELRQEIGGSLATSLGIHPAVIPQSTFVDGTMTGLNCTVIPCWPGIRGTDLGAPGGIDDNVNSPFGDSVVVALFTPWRANGMGINWRQGFDKNVNGGRTIAHTNSGYNPALGPPQVIYRLFDPATRTWSPFDSSALDADAVQINGTDTLVLFRQFRFDWPPRDRIGLNLPGGFSVNGVAAYAALSFLPRGTRMQYYFKSVDIAGNVGYEFGTWYDANEVVDLPTLPGSSIKAPDILEFTVLPGRYTSGSAGSLLAGRTTTPLLHLDAAYTAWSFDQNPVVAALRGLGVRYDTYRFLSGVDLGTNIGGHELPGQRPMEPSNFFPNPTEYWITDSLAAWYRIILVSAHSKSYPSFDESDGLLLRTWWEAPTGTNQGDRCMLATGDHFFYDLLGSTVPPVTQRVGLAQNVFGVATAADAWNGTGTVGYPVVEDRFANPGSGPGLLAGFTYPVDGGCPTGKKFFDAFTRVGSSETQNTCFYPSVSGITDVAAVASQAERDIITDLDRSKALGYGFSLQYVRKAGIPIIAPNFARSGVEERMKILYKFLASCRGARSGAPADTAKCWPCPTDANMMGNWAALAGFQTGQYGPLYPIQDHLTATAVEEPASGNAPFVNSLLQNRPNPFNPETTIPFSLGTTGRVEIRVFDVSGRVVRTLVSGVKPAGLHSVRWNGRTDEGGRVASGVYFYRITYPDGSVSAKKLAMLR